MLCFNGSAIRSAWLCDGGHVGVERRMVCALLQTHSEDCKVATVNTVPYWQDAISLPMLHRLDRDIRVDVGIIGGGVAGITSAYLLKAAGRTVALLDRDRLGSGD